MNHEYHLAIDIGASGGKCVLGYKEKDEYKNEVIFRFSNSYSIDKAGHKIWDIKSLFANVIQAINIAVDKVKNVKTLSIDTWGCDYVLLDKNDKEILPCYSYRDSRAEDIIDEVFSKISKEKLYELTCSQFQKFNTLFQLYKDKKEGRLNDAETFLMLPEYLMFKLTGVKAHEITNASTTNLLEKDKYDYSKEIINTLGLPERLFSTPKKVGFVLGDLLPSIQKIVNANIKVKFCPTHDTASTIRFLKENESDTLYLSSGTWSLLGVKTDKYIINEKAYKSNFSNELGPNYVRFQKNIMGLWIIQNLIKEYDDQITLAIKEAQTSYFTTPFDVNDPSFLNPKSMKTAILNYFKNHDFPIPLDKKDLYSTTFISLAKYYKKTIKEIEDILNQKFKNIYIS